MTASTREFEHGAHGIARILSKLGRCSRRQGWEYVRAGRVKVNGQICRDPEKRVDPARDQLELDGEIIRAAQKVYVALNKPRGLVTSAVDEQGRKTVFSCLEGHGLPLVSAVGRLDKASEGLLLFTNDTQWAAGITAPGSRLEKVYHVQVDCVPDQTLLERMNQGVRLDGELLSAKRVSLLRHGEKNSWLEVVLTEGKNRQIRRMLEAHAVSVMRLIRVRIGLVELGTLAKGALRHLTAREIAGLGEGAPTRKN